MDRYARPDQASPDTRRADGHHIDDRHRSEEPACQGAGTPGISAFDYVKEVTTDTPYGWSAACWKWGCTKGEVGSGKWEVGSEKQAYASRSVVVYDFGVKFNILRNLVDAGFQVTVARRRPLPNRCLS